MSHELTIGLISAIFLIGYALITLESLTKIDKATVALLMAIFCWVFLFDDVTRMEDTNLASLCHHLANITQVIFFLLGALTIVETINAHKGFKVISDLIRVSNKTTLFWVIGIITFFLSSILDNLTTTVVMVTLLQKILHEREDKLLMGGGIVIAANAGGAWTPIGDVTTTMLWIGGQLSTLAMLKTLFLPSVACAATSLALLSRPLKGNFKKKELSPEDDAIEPYGKVIFILGILALMSVPVFKLVTGLPPFMGMLFALGILWLVTDLMHYRFDTREHLRVPHVLSKIDLPGTLFFLGILLCISALEVAGILDALAVYLNTVFGNLHVIAILIGIVSAIVDNVPLVAATMAMYDLNVLPQDASFWQLTAFTAGTGGSLLIVGSAAGVVFMGLEKVDFLWYVKKISFAAFIGYLVGVAVYLLQLSLIS